MITCFLRHVLMKSQLNVVNNKDKKIKCICQLTYHNVPSSFTVFPYSTSIIATPRQALKWRRTMVRTELIDYLIFLPLLARVSIFRWIFVLNFCSSNHCLKEKVTFSLLYILATMIFQWQLVIWLKIVQLQGIGPSSKECLIFIFH